MHMAISAWNLKSTSSFLGGMHWEILSGIIQGELKARFPTFGQT